MLCAQSCTGVARIYVDSTVAFATPCPTACHVRLQDMARSENLTPNHCFSSVAQAVVYSTGAMCSCCRPHVSRPIQMTKTHHTRRSYCGYSPSYVFFCLTFVVIRFLVPPCIVPQALSARAHPCTLSSHLPSWFGHLHTPPLMCVSCAHA